MANCTGANSQFGNTTACMDFCAQYPVGTAADSSGYTLGCRTTHANLAQANPTVHCPHAGPTGGDMNPNGTAGVCGEPCDAFCDTAQVVCTAANAQWASKSACVTACKAFAADNASFSTADTSRNDVGCRTNHLEFATASSAAATTHCPHLATVSAVCNM